MIQFTDIYTHHQGPRLLTWINFIIVWISNYIHLKVWGEITHPFPNFNDALISCEYLLQFKLIPVSKRGPRRRCDKRRRVWCCETDILSSLPIKHNKKKFFQYSRFTVINLWWADEPDLRYSERRSTAGPTLFMGSEEIFIYMCVCVCIYVLQPILSICLAR